jgi:hypothetical protein
MMAGMTDTKHIESWGKGRLEMIGDVKVLHLRGGDYDRGFQHGRLLGSLMEQTIPRGMAAAAAVCAKAIGLDYAEGLARLLGVLRNAAGFIPESMKEEIHGMADALAARGSRLNFDDLIAWNLMYDTWCYYAHPGFKDPDPDILDADIPDTIGCSSFSAWGEATTDGSLIFGKNMDNLDLPGIPEGRILTICSPDEGLGYANITQAGMVAIDGGLNEAGIAMMTHYSGSILESLRGCGIGVLSRQILQKADSLEKAIEILVANPRCTGINYHVADGKAKSSAVVEANAENTALRRPWGGDFLWSTNHCNCYPGWMGYQGINMVEAQAPVYGLKDISSIPAWQESLKERDNPHIAASGRFRRYEALLKEHYGTISMEKGVDILRDRRDPDTGEMRDWDIPAKARNDGMTISYLLPRKYYADYIPWYKGEGGGPVSGQSMNLWSMVAKPETGEFGVALTEKPGHRGEFLFFNLREELEKDWT